MNRIKVCVFCNKHPVGKNKEHVLPDWLIKYTGNQNRSINVPGLGTTVKTFNFRSFTFPACEKCNSEFSILEKNAKCIVEKMTNKLPLSSNELEILMDWLDKVRIGIWLGSIMYSKNPLGIIPHYGIATRPKKDRLLIISTTKEPSLRLTFSGFNDPLFHHLPCFFGIYINGISLISLSADCLFFGELPLPNFDRIAETRSGKITVQLKPPKTSRISLPYVGKRFTLLAQLNYPQRVEEKYFSKEQIKFMKNDINSSKVLIINKNLSIYPEKPSNKWESERYNTRDNLFKEQNLKFLRLRNWVAKKGLKNSTNPFIKNLYSKLLKSKIISENF